MKNKIPFFHGLLLALAIVSCALVQPVAAEQITSTPAKPSTSTTAATTDENCSDSNSVFEGLTIFHSIIGLSDADPRLIVARLIRIGLGFLGIIFLLIILSAGFQWMTSGGDEEKVHAAGSSLRNAIIGIIIIFCAYSIVTFVLSALHVSNGGTIPSPAATTGSTAI